MLSDHLLSSYSGFDKDDFMTKVFDDDWESRGLKQRMRHIANSIYLSLPQEYPQAISILKQTFSKISTGHGLENMVFQDYVEVYGMDDVEHSLKALEHFTVGSSSEFAIRRFILKYPERTMRQMRLWATNEDHHIRRLASEGCRPRLPWAIALPVFKDDPTEVIKILEMLKDDVSEYVRKSVANNLNDISKENPLIVIDIAKRWIGTDLKRNRIIKHGCRTLLKRGNRSTLAIFGLDEIKELQIEKSLMPDKIKMGERIDFSFRLSSTDILGRLRVEYAISFLRQDNRYSTKVFKISEGLVNKSYKDVSSSYSFRPITTRKYYRGRHRLALIVNGITLIEKEFDVT